MLRVVFVGVGEAFDEDLFNNSHLIISQSKLLLDCGYAIPTHLWKHYPDPNFLDAVYVSHTHADHIFGLPILFLKMWEQRRSKPLTIVARKGIRARVADLTDYAYPSLYGKLTFGLDFIEVREQDSVTLNEFQLKFAASSHSVVNFAVKVWCGTRSICYSGDGMFTEATARLYEGTDLLIHEAYVMESNLPGHSGVKEVVAMARKLGVRSLALTHLQQELRREKGKVLSYLQQQADILAFLPEPMDHLDLD